MHGGPAPAGTPPAETGPCHFAADVLPLGAANPGYPKVPSAELLRAH